MKASRVDSLALLLFSVFLAGCTAYGQEPPGEARKVKVTTVQSKAVTLTQSYVCRIESRHEIDVRAPEDGYLQATPLTEGQAVKRGDLLFQLRPLRGKDAPGDEKAAKVVSIHAPFDGNVDRLRRQQDSLVLKGETFTRLYDNSAVRVYFDVPEARYLEYQSARQKDDPKIELVLANGKKFDHPGKLGAIGAVFKNGNVSFRADFPNPDGQLRHGQAATVLMGRVQDNALVIPQRATYEVRDKRYVLVVDKDDVAHERKVVVQTEVDDLFVVKSGVRAGDKIVVEGDRRLRNGGKVKY
jgi:membrane fusion protein (multidrug efflux system)